MRRISNEEIIKIIKKDVVRALGCTEPISACLAVVKGRELLGEAPERVDLFVSGNIYKNGMGVGIPGTDMTGLKVAAALGALTGKSEDALEVLRDVTPKIGEQAKDMVIKEKVNIQIKEGVDKLYVEAICFAGKHTSRVVIQKRHTNIIEAYKDGVLMFEKCEDSNTYKKTDEGKVEGLTVARLFEFAQNAPLDSLRFILEGVEPNWDIAQNGLKGEYGLQVGRKLRKSKLKSLLENDIMTSAMSKAAAGVDARMAGSIMPVMTNSGSGNQGITIYVPIIDFAKKIDASEEELTRALILGNAIPIHIKMQIGPLSALCGLVPASTGAACGITYLMGGGIEHIQAAIKYMLANTSGVFCDGAKPACALKTSTGISAAVQAAIFALDNSASPLSDGVVSDDVEETIDNLARIASHGMLQTDIDILNVMINK
ncbi:MAG: L-serine ammonia-lyase, iron-sulfur-dependent, subunit alpha [Cytophagales bacterium]|nr:L-serine ammonia-lyase, iron-sulfur-dependent, subunit alpha [Cytophagales bacterium]